MGYGYSSRRFSYESPDPEDLDSASVQELVDGIKDAIDAEKLKDTKSYLSKLKLAINNQFPLWTETSATFGAYVYAKGVGKKKVVDSLYKAMIKKNYTYDGFPLMRLVNTMPKGDFQIIVNDFLNDSATKWQFDGPLTLEVTLKEYPKEAAQWIKDGRLNKFEKGEIRVETALKVIEFAPDADTIIAGINTFFDMSYVQQYGIHPNKMDIMLKTLSKRTNAIQKKVLKGYFYTTALKDIHYRHFQEHFEKGYLDEQTITNYTITILRKSPKQLLEVLTNITDEELRTQMVTVNDEVIDLVTQNRPNLLPKSVTDMFLF
jgi:hypothetical protein